MQLDSRKIMINIVPQYFNVNRILLLAIGLWPYQRTKFVQFRAALLFGILMSFIIFQFTTFMTVQLSVNFVIKMLSIALLSISFMINYTSFWVNIQRIKCLIEELYRIYNELQDDNEIAILEKYGYDARRYTINILLLTICSLLVILVQPLYSYILNVLPLINNESWSCVPLTIEYFIDQEKYCYIILLHVSAAVCIGAIALIATGTLLIGSLKQACGMFMIASYRIEQAITSNTLKKIEEDKIFIYKRIICAVDIHRKAMQFAGIVVNSFERLFFFLITIGVLCLSLNLFRIFQVMKFESDIEEMMIPFLCGIIILLYMFLANYAGQEITDHNDHVYRTAYSVRWYITPLHVQKLLLFLLQRGSKTFSLNVGGLFSASLECFASLASASVSYFTVMYSMQH